MYFAGFTLNSISLLALALVIGILVDDAIVEVENIARHLRMGKSPRQAAIEASGEIGLAVLATTVTLVAVFLPTAFMGGISGKLFRQFGVTACAALLFSLLVARMLTPMMAAYLLRAQTHEAHDSRLMTRYLGWIHTSLSRRGTTIALVGVLLLGSLALIPLLPTSFLPAQDDARTTLSLELAPGSSLAQTAAMALQADARLRTLPEVAHVFASVGSGEVSSDDQRKAVLTVDLLPRRERALKQSEVEATAQGHRQRDFEYGGATAGDPDAPGFRPGSRARDQQPGHCRHLAHGHLWRIFIVPGQGQSVPATGRCAGTHAAAGAYRSGAYRPVADQGP